MKYQYIKIVIHYKTHEISIYLVLDAYRITPHTTRTFILCRTYVKEGVRVINGYINQNIFTAIL